MSIKLAEKYIRQVLSGEKLVCATIKMAVDRHEKDLIDGPERGFYFDRKAAERVFAFFQVLNHCPDKAKWVPFEVEDWQALIIYLAFGWKKADKTRRFTYVYTEIAKKNGKTTFAAAIAAYLLFFDGEAEAEVYCAATVEKQARICFDKTKQMIIKSPALANRAMVLRRNINIESTASKMEPIGRDSDSIEGANPSGAIIDEYHIWKNNEVMDNLRSGAVNRNQPFFFIITTAGKDKTLPCYSWRILCIDILRGIKQQDDILPFIFTLDDEDDWKDEVAWYKSNPNIGVSVRLDAMRREFKAALNDPRQEANFKTKNLNLWVDAPETWIKDERIRVCDYGTTDAELSGKVCYVGLDIASHVDICALAIFFPVIEGRPVAKFHFWIPEAKVLEKEDRVDYRTWASMGFVTITPGDVIDIDQLTDNIYDIIQQYQCEGFAFDPAKAFHGVIQNLQKLGLEELLDEYSQGIRSMSEPTKLIERMVTSAEIDLMGNPVIRWMFSNVQIISDQNENIKADKRKSREKIDGIVALANAVGEWQTKLFGASTVMTGELAFFKI
ncbi:MAG: terminase TerL endonuclease subunit [Mariniphaga sp.]